MVAREQMLVCSRTPDEFEDCIFALCREIYGDCSIVRAHCETHDGGELLIGLAVVVERVERKRNFA